MTLAGDRLQLVSRLASTLTELNRFYGGPIHEVRQILINDAFDACADVGVFNRRHPSMRITPLTLA
jgi:hypothetical protein